MNEEERKELIFKYAIDRISAMSEDDLRAFYLENLTDCLDTFDDDQLLAL